jgi:hypothetical protein
MTDDEAKQAWIAFASSALCGICVDEDIEEDEEKTTVVNEACEIADMMLDQLEERFTTGRRKRRRL